MLRVPYQYIESEVAPFLSLISRILGIGYAFLGLLGLSFIIRLGELYIGLGCIAAAIVVFFISRQYNASTEKTIKEIMEKQPEKVIEIWYKRELQDLRDSFAKKEISKEELVKREELLKQEKAEELRKCKETAIETPSDLIVDESEQIEENEDTVAEEEELTEVTTKTPVDLIVEESEQIEEKDDSIPEEALRSLKSLFDAGVLTEQEFTEKKRKLLNI